MKQKDFAELSKEAEIALRSGDIWKYITVLHEMALVLKSENKYWDELKVNTIALAYAVVAPERQFKETAKKILAGEIKDCLSKAISSRDCCREIIVSVIGKECFPNGTDIEEVANEVDLLIRKDNSKPKY